MFASILTRKFNPNHDEKGKFAPKGTGISGGARNHLHEMFDRIGQPDGGFTYQPTTEEEPKEGYALSPYPEKSFAKPVAEFGFKDLVAYYLKNQEAFNAPDHFIGAWHDPASHHIFLDVSVVKQSEAEATKLALEKDQIAYFDLKNFKSVTVNPDAKSGVLKDGKETGIVIGEAGRGFGAVFADRTVQKVDGPGADAGRTGRSKGNVGATPLAHLIARIFKRNDNHDPKNGQFASNPGGPSESSVRSGQGEGKGISLRPQQPDAESADLIHYGTQGDLSQLNAGRYGTGIRGAEAARLAKSNDSNIKSRVYFYLNDGSGKLPRKEQGLGAHVYAVKLTNLYDFKKDPAKIIPRMREIADQTDRSNFMESEIVKAGYDGYALKAYNMAVVLGKDVPVEYKGTDTKKAAFGFAQVLKHNPYHDQHGLFTTHASAHFISMWGKDYAKAKNKPEFSMDQYQQGMKELTTAMASAPAAFPTPSVADPKQAAKDQYKADQKTLEASVIAATKEHIMQGPHGYYMDPPTPTEQGLQSAFKNLVASHMEVYPHDIKDMAELELSQMADIPYQAKYKLGMPLMPFEKEQVAKDLKDLMIPKELVGGGWTTPTDLGTYGQPKKEYDKVKVSQTIESSKHIADVFSALSSVSDQMYWKSPSEVLDMEENQSMTKLKSLYKSMVADAQAAAPGFEGQAEAQVSKWMTNNGLSTVAKHKLGMYLSDSEKENIASTIKQINQSKVYTLGVSYQSALSAMHLAKLTNNTAAYNEAKAMAAAAKAKAAEAGLDEYGLSGYEEMAKENADFEFKSKQKEAVADFTKTYAQHVKDQRAGKPVDTATIEQNKKFWMDKGLMTADEAAKIMADETKKGTALSDFHKQLKASLPEAKSLSAEYDGKKFAMMSPYSLEAEDFFDNGKSVYDTLPSSVKSIVRDYTSSGYKQNKKVGIAATKKMLGLSADLDEDTKVYVKKMDEATSHEIGKDVVLARNFPTKFMLEQMGISLEQVKKMTPDERTKFFVGKLYRDNTYGSTSVNTNFTGSYSAAANQGEGKFTIRAPASTKGIAVENFTNNNGEHEVILQRGTTYLIRSVSMDDGWGEKLYFDVDVIHQHPDKLD